MRQHSISALFLLLTLSRSGFAEPRLHIVQRGETLSTVAQDHLGSPVYPKRTGSLARLLDLNPGLRMGDVIYPGQTLRLPGELGESREPAQADLPPTPPAVEPVKKSEVPQLVQLGFSYGSTSILARDTTTAARSELHSKFDFLVTAEMRQKWSDRLLSFQKIGLRQVDFEPSTNPNKELLRTSQQLTQMAVGGESRLSENFWLRYSLNYGNEIFLGGRTSTSVALSAAPVWSARLEPSFVMFQRGKTIFGTRARISYLGSAATDEYAVRSGYGYAAGVFIERIAKTGKSLSVHLDFAQREQNTSAVELAEREFTLGLSYSLPIFEGGSW